MFFTHLAFAEAHGKTRSVVLFLLKNKPFSNLLPFEVQIIIIFLTQCFMTNDRRTKINEELTPPALLPSNRHSNVRGIFVFKRLLKEILVDRTLLIECGGAFNVVSVFDSDQDNKNEIQFENSIDCISASDNDGSSDSDATDQLTDSDIDPEYFKFPISFHKADVCVRLHELVQAGRIPNNRIFHKYLNSVTLAIIDPSHQFDEEVVEFFNSIKFLGGERTVNFIRGPMGHDCGRGGVQDPLKAKPNLGGPSRTTRNKCSSGYTTKSGTVKPWLDSFLQLSNGPHLGVETLIETPILNVFVTAMENDSTALKPTDKRWP